MGAAIAPGDSASARPRQAQPDFVALIPARLASTRLPDKPLADIGGRPMVVRVAERARAAGAQRVAIATDSERIAEAVRAAGHEAVMTAADHPSGTDRLAEAARLLGLAADTIVVNVQGDEPLIPPALIRSVAEHLHAHPECAIATACHAIHDEASMRNPNIVKAVLDRNGNALYFSRAPIPYPRDAFAAQQPLPQDLPVLRHIGIYAYRASFLRAYGKLAPAAIEQFEALEQLRALYHGYKIGVFVAGEAPPAGVDTEQDLHAARRHFELETNGGDTK